MKWINCSKLMPKYEQLVILCYKNQWNELTYDITMLRKYNDGEKFWLPSMEMFTSDKNKPIAWCKLNEYEEID